MGFNNEPKTTTVHPESRGYENQLMEIMNQFLSGQNTPQIGAAPTAPDTPLHQQAMQQAQASTGAHGADMQKFYANMMAGGGRANLDQATRAMAQRGARDDQNIMAQLMASGLPVNSTAMARASTGELSDAALNRNLGLTQMELANEQQAMQNQFAGAQGLHSMPGYFAQPTSIEAQMLGLRMPYDQMAHQGRISQAQLENQQQGFGAQLAGGFLNNNWYQPDTIVHPDYNFWRDTAAPAVT